MTPMAEDDHLPETVEIRAFGQKLQLLAPKVAFLRQDSLWRLKTHYMPAMSARSLDLVGVALDIGAGFGAFALPFALANPGWAVYAFEPDPQCFAALKANAQALGATNLVAIPAAVGDTAEQPADPDALFETFMDLPFGDPATEARLQALLPQRDFARHLQDHGYMQPGLPPSDSFQGLRLPTIPANILAQMDPTLVKLTAPMLETPIFAALKDVALDHILGERWSHLDSTLAAGADRPGRRETWMPQVGGDLIVLRHGPQPLRTGLDVVVALYNQRNFIFECVANLLANDEAPLRVIVVDDGSTDDSAACVEVDFGSHPRVTLLRKANGGCASARNYGRMHSDASHIAFVDADDLADPGLFPDLFELARQTGAEVVQAGFHLLEEDGSRSPSIESRDPLIHHATRHVLGARTCHLVPAAHLVPGQPSIWRRVYRRDFLDNRKIWFPEHIRAFDDQIFQLLTLQPLVNVPMLDGLTYGYRQHPGQDIRQKDERHFYSLEMFRIALRRGLAEGWHDFRPLLRSFVNTVNWVTRDLRPDLLDRFCQGTAELWTLMHKVLPPDMTGGVSAADFHCPGLAPHLARFEAALIGLPASSAYAVLDSLAWQVPMVRAPWDAL